jgi:hypothetical protein
MQEKEINKDIKQEEAIAPASAMSLRLRQKVQDVIDAHPQGQALADYFGIPGALPLQSAQEAATGEQLIQELKTANDQQANLANLLGKIAEHAEQSAVDPNTLRDLMYKKQRP